MTKFKTYYEFASDFYITHRGIKYNNIDLDIIFEQIQEKNTQTNWEIKKNDPFNLSDETKKKIETLEIRMKASSWKSNQRTLRRKGKLDQYKIETLNKLGMVWNPKEDEWEKKYLSFRKKGFCYGLEVWIKEQRELYNKEQIPIENLQRLKAINFPFKEEKNEQFPFTYDCHNNLSNIYLNKSVKAWKKEESTKAWKKEGNRISEEFANSENGKIRDAIYLALRRIDESFIKNLYKISYEESISLIDKILDGENIFRNNFIIAKYSQHIINKNGLKGKFGNPKYYSFYSSQQNLFKPTEKFDIELCKILSIPDPRLNEKLDGSEIYYYLNSFFNKHINPLVRKYCCEKMLNFFETIWSERMRSFAPLDYLISFHKSEKNIDEILKLKNYIEKYPLLSLLYKDKIDGILSKI
tara:strand:+ start:3021 stop:4253 length:1233 start_codon:yes stop_codon:yes gene_type:complete